MGKTGKFFINIRKEEERKKYDKQKKISDVLKQGWSECEKYRMRKGIDEHWFIIEDEDTLPGWALVTQMCESREVHDYMLTFF